MGLEKRENLAVRKAETHSFEDVILWLCNTHRLRMKRLLELNFFVHNNYKMNRCSLFVLILALAIMGAQNRLSAEEATNAAPEGMNWIPGGEFSMGSAVQSESFCTATTMDAVKDAQPIHRVYVDGFWMDKNRSL